MVRAIQLPCCNHSSLPSMPIAIGLLVTITALVALCAKRAANKFSRKYESIEYDDESKSSYSPLQVAKMPWYSLAALKKLFATISDKAIPFISNNRKAKASHEEGFGEGGVWQKNILMGERCRPLEFSGVIYYDHQGNQIPELPKSPRPANFLPNPLMVSSL